MRDASLDEFLSGTDEAEEDVSAVECEANEVAAAAESASEPEIEDEQEPDADPTSDTGTEAETEAETETGAEMEGPPPAAAVEPARSTFAWSPDGATCAACGESVEERWESEVGLVCVACKEW